MCSPDIPDTSAAQKDSVAATERMANRQYELQQESLDYFKERQNKLDATADKVTERQLALAETTTAQGTDLYNYQKEVFRPVEQSLVSQAMRESTPEYYEKYAQEAVARVAAAQGNAAGQTERALASMGVNPNSGAFASAQRGLQLQNAAALGAASNESYDRAESLGWARRAEVAGLGKGLVGAGNASYGLATGASSAAVSAGNQTAQTAGANLGTSTQYAGLGLQGATAVMNGQNDIYKAGLNYAAATDSTGQILGAIGQGVGAYMAS